MKNQKRFWGVVLMALGCSAAGPADEADAVSQALNVGGAPSECTGAPVAACSKFSATTITGACCTCQGNSGVFRPTATANVYNCVTTCVPCGSVDSCVRYSTSSDYFAGRCCTCGGAGGPGIHGNLRSTPTANVWKCE